MAAKYLSLVYEDEKDEAGFSPSYLDSLEIRRPKIIDVNLLWGDVQENDFSDVLVVASELLEIGISGAGLEIYDRESGSLRPATDFRLGRKGTQGVPLIEKQYAKLGRKLGDLLGLPEENEVSTFLGIFENMISTGPSVLNDLSGEIYRLLRYWQDWDTRSRGLIAADLQVTLDKHNIASPPVAVFNDPDKLISLKKAGVLALGLKINDRERYALERSARELGLILPEDAGDLEVTGEEPLDKQELIRFDHLLSRYVESLEEHEKSRLAAQAAGLGFGNYEIWNILSLCPNCHAVSKHGGRDMLNIYTAARAALQGNIFPVELTQYKGDFYLVPVSINGQNKELAISKRHMSYFAGLFKAEEEVAATGK